MVISSPSSGSRMPGGFPTPEDINLPAIPESDNRGRQPPRRTSFNFLRRGKSVERQQSSRSTSGGKLTKKQMREQEATAVPRQPPKIPDLTPSPQLQSFGGDVVRPDSLAIMSNRAGGYNQGRPTSREPRGTFFYHDVPIPPIPGSNPGGKAEYVDPYARTESMTNRGRYSYASSLVSTINTPRRVRRRRDPTPFNILVVGARNSGKTSFLEFLRTSLALPERKQRPHGRDDHFGHSAPFSMGVSPNFKPHYLETEIDGERIGLTLWDSEGLEKSIVDLQLRDISSFLESKFEDTFSEEMKVVRSPGVRDTHIHCVFLVLDPLRLDMNIAAAQKAKDANGTFVNGRSFIHPPSPTVLSGLDEDLDLQVLRTLQGKTTVVPVISKADTITTAHMSHLKRLVWDSLKKANLDPLEALGLDDGEGDAESADENNNNHFDERDEDDAIRLRNHLDINRPKLDRHASMTSHLDSASSSSSSSPNRKNNHKPQSHQAPPQRLSSQSRTHSSSGLQPDTNTTTPYLPLSIISPDLYEPQIIGRKFPWGFADPYNAEHCDFQRLKEAVFKEWRGELREASRELWYEGWRTSRLNEREREKERDRDRDRDRGRVFDEGVGTAR